MGGLWRGMGGKWGVYGDYGGDGGLQGEYMGGYAGYGGIGVYWGAMGGYGGISHPTPPAPLTAGGGAELPAQLPIAVGAAAAPGGVQPIQEVVHPGGGGDGQERAGGGGPQISPMLCCRPNNSLHFILYTFNVINHLFSPFFLLVY